MRHVLSTPGYLFATYLAATLAIPAGVRIVARIRRRHRTSSRRRPRWRLALLVRVDEEARRIHPSVQIQGDAIPPRARIRCRVIDEDRRTRFANARPLPADANRTELPLPTIAAPKHVDLDDVLRWRWEISISSDGRRVARWSQRLEAFGGVNPEAEIKLV